MSSKKKSMPMEEEEFEKKPGLFHRKRFNLIYTGIIILLFILGGTLILVFTLVPAIQSDYGFFGGLGVMGLAIILFTSRTTYKHSIPTKDSNDEQEEEDDGLQMRRR